VKQNWIVWHDATQGEMAYAMECLRCGDIQKVATPINVDCLCAMMKAYAKNHRSCRPRNDQERVKP